MQHSELTDEEFATFCGLIYRTAGIRIAENKRILVGNRVRRRLRATGIAGFREYHAFLTSPAGAGEMPQFLDAITTNETYFFRDIHHYEWLGGEFLPEVARLAASHKHPRRLRIWSAACSTGEEPYSMAIEIAEKRPILAGWDIRVLGTDLSGAVLTEARVGCYDARAVRLVEPALRRLLRRGCRRRQVDRQGHAQGPRRLEAAQPPLAAARGPVRLHFPQKCADLL